jgi:hypothetical protein
MSCFRRIRDASHVSTMLVILAFGIQYLTVYKNGANDYATSGPLGSAIATGRGLQRLHQGGNKTADCRRLHAWLLLAGMAIALSGCVSGGDPAMFTSVQGFVPDRSGSRRQRRHAQVADGFSYGGNRNRIRIRHPAANALTDSSRCGCPFAGNPETRVTAVVMASTGVDALNRGITQSMPNQTGANIYAATAPLSPCRRKWPHRYRLRPRLRMDATGKRHGRGTESSRRRRAAPQVQELAVVAPPKETVHFFAAVCAAASSQTKCAVRERPSASPSPKPTRVAMASASSRHALPGVSLCSVLGTDSGKPNPATARSNISWHPLPVSPGSRRTGCTSRPTG